ncbi:MAG: PEP-CTERM sorting domain-containing protein [Phycisphaeraceae bacterium]
MVNLGFVAVPEPGSLALLAAGGLMMIKRRRRDA